VTSLFHPPLVISHRTHAGTMPENTLLGVQAALDAGVDAIEIDVRATADGVVVLQHDPTFERMTGDPSHVASVSYAQVTELYVRDPAGRSEPQCVPTLADVLELVAGRAVVVVEVKQVGIQSLVAAAVRAAGAAHWTWVWAFNPVVARATRAALPEVPVTLTVAPGSLSRFGYPDRPLDLAVEHGFAGVSWNYRMVDADVVRTARRRGLATYCWTPNEDADIERVVRAGVDGVCSDFPDRVQALVDRLAEA
jgi:glycerophosphoryl diester phosphodiesterase